MLNFFKHLKYKHMIKSIEQEIEPEKIEKDDSLTSSLLDNMVCLREKYNNSSDLNVREITINNIKLSLLVIEGMVNLQLLSEMISEPLLNQNFPEDTNASDIYSFIEERSMMSSDMKDCYSFEELFKFIMSGFVVILIDGLNYGIAMGAQGFSFRSISESSSEINERGCREGFTEPIRINMTLVRRRMKSPLLKFELLTIGKTSKTDICMMYMTNVVSKKLLREIRYKLHQIDLDVILTSGYLQPFLESSRWSFFSDVGLTERPDTLCAKIQEGRVAIMIDGTPFVLIVPYLFSENFQSVDDYCHKPYYATFVRILKYLSFTITILLPGVYVAIGTFHPELFPHSLLFNVASSQETTPFPLVIEALVIHLIYEVMREAGLRLPRPVGHAVSIVGALVIGDAAVTAGLIGSPMVLVVALTAISSFVVPSLHEPMSILRFGFILIGGIMGLYGIALGSAMVMVNASSLTAFGVPYLSPIAPFSSSSMRDTFVRAGFKTMQKKTAQIEDLNGAHIESDSDGQ